MKKSAFAITCPACVRRSTADTLKKIRDSGSVTMGVREASGVLSYTLGDGKFARLPDRPVPPRAGRHPEAAAPAEAGHQVCVRHVRQPHPADQNGTIDIECGSTTINAARQQQVSFALTTYVEEVRMAVKTSSGITSINQLAGRSVATTSGTTSVQMLRKHERAKGVDFREIFGKDHTDSMLILESGRADAFVMDAQVLAANIARTRSPADFRIVGEVLGVEPLAIMLRKDDPGVQEGR